MTLNSGEDQILSLATALGAKVSKTKPGTYRIQARVSVAERIVLGLFSLGFFSVLAGIPVWLLTPYLGADIARPFAVFCVFVLWIWLNFRGVSIKIDTLGAQYSQFGIISYEGRRPLPAFRLQAEERETSLFVAEYKVASSCDVNGLRLLAKSLGLAEADMHKAEKGQTNSEHSPADIATIPDDLPTDRKRGSKKVILVHGTFARKSPWAFADPVRSLITKRLGEHAGFNGEVERFAWSGRNSSKARDIAARELSEQLKQELSEFDRKIYLIGHSHGGNVAMAAAGYLPVGLQPNVAVCTLGTPFLDWNTRFRVSALIDELPEFLLSNLNTASFLGFWALCLAAFFMIQETIISPEHQVSLLGGDTSLVGVVILVLLMWGPLWIFNRLSRRFSAVFEARNHEAGSANIDKRSPVRTLVINFDHDEALQALGTVIGLFSLTQIVLFFAAYRFLRWTKKAKIVDFLGGAGCVILWLALVGVAAVAGLAYLASLLGFPIHHFVSSTDTLETIARLALFCVLFVLVASGILFIGMLAIFCLFGSLRAAIFWLAGVLDYQLSKQDFLEVIFGSVSVTSVPHGASEVFVFHGSRMFNHTKIYDEDAPVNRIVSFIVDE